MVAPSVEDAFGFAEMPVVSFAGLYGGKVVAALDRQHPRDLFDVHDLLANEGVTGEIRRAFIVYLLSHKRPMSEVLAPTPNDIEGEFKRGFAGMTETDVSLGDLLEARESLVAAITGGMPGHHRGFCSARARMPPTGRCLRLKAQPICRLYSGGSTIWTSWTVQSAKNSQHALPRCSGLHPEVALILDNAAQMRSDRDDGADAAGRRAT